MPRIASGAGPRWFWLRPGQAMVFSAAVAAAVLALVAGSAARAATRPAAHGPETAAAASVARKPFRGTLAAHGPAAPARSASPSPSPSQPASPTPMPTPAPQPTPSSGGCGFFDFGCQIGHAIDSWFAGLVSSAINPLFRLLGETLLSTPQIGGFSTVRNLWTGSVAIADACYVLLVLVGGILVMGHQTVQSSYAVKDIAPRLVVGFIAANLSLLLAGKAIQFADGMSAALAGQGLDPAAAGAMLRSLVERVLSQGGMFFILLALFAVALVLVLTVIYVARLMLTVVLIAMAPLALACHALPQTEGFARWWWRAFAGILAIQAAQALVLVAAARVFFTEQWASLILNGLNGPGAAVAFDAVQLICLLYILIRIPFWIFRRVWSPGSRSPVRSAARFVFAAAVLRRVAPVLSGRSGGRTPAGRPGTSGRRSPGGPGGPGSGPRPATGTTPSRQRARSPPGPRPVRDTIAWAGRESGATARRAQPRRQTWAGPAAAAPARAHDAACAPAQAGPGVAAGQGRAQS